MTDISTDNSRVRVYILEHNLRAAPGSNVKPLIFWTLLNEQTFESVHAVFFISFSRSCVTRLHYILGEGHSV